MQTSHFLFAHPQSLLRHSLIFPAWIIPPYLFIMTNNVKKCTYKSTSPADNQPSGPSSGSDPSTQTLEELQEQNKELRHCLQKYKGEALFFLLPKKKPHF